MRVARYRRARSARRPGSDGPRATVGRHATAGTGGGGGPAGGAAPMASRICATSLGARRTRRRGYAKSEGRAGRQPRARRVTPMRVGVTGDMAVAVGTGTSLEGA